MNTFRKISAWLLPVLLAFALALPASAATPTISTAVVSATGATLTLTFTVATASANVPAHHVDRGLVPLVPILSRGFVLTQNTFANNGAGTWTLTYTIAPAVPSDVSLKVSAGAGWILQATDGDANAAFN